MKKLFILMFCFCTTLSAMCQTPISKDLSFMKAYKAVDLTFNFECCMIDNMTYDDYASYYDSMNKEKNKFKTSAQHAFISKFVDGFNENGRVTTSYLTQKTDSLSKIKVAVNFTEVDNAGDVKGYVNIYEKASNLLLATFDFKGRSSTDGTIVRVSKKVANVFTGTDHVDIDNLMPLSMQDAGFYVGDKLANAGKARIQVKKLFNKKKQEE